MTSFLRPGLVGVVLGFVSILTLGGQARGEGRSVAELEGEIKTEERRLEKAEEDLAEVKEEADELRAKAEEAEKMNDFVANAEKEKTELLAAVDEMEEKLKRSMRLLHAYRKLGGADTDIEAGAELGDLIMPDGRTLKGAVVSRVEGGNIGLRHSAGVGTFSVGDLPESVASHFMVPPTSAFPGPMPNLQQVLAGSPGGVDEADANDEAAVAKAGPSATTKARNEKAAAEDASRQVYEAKRQELLAKIQEAKKKRDASDNAYYVALKAMRAKEREMNYGSNTRVSSSDQKKVLAPYHQQMATYDKARSDWNAEANRLYGELKALRR